MSSEGKVRAVLGKSLIDGNGGKPVEDVVILVEGNRIKGVGKRSATKLPENAEVVDCSDCVLMPGLMDLHIHTFMFNCLTFKNYRVAQWEVMPQLQQMYSLFHAQMCLDMGFTFLRDLGLNSSRGLLTHESCAVRDAINAGILEGPRMYVAGWTSITNSHLDLVQPRAMLRTGFQTADGPWELRKLARTNLLAGCDVIKTCASGGGGTDKEEPDVRNMTQEELDAIVDEAHAFHKTCAVHCFTPSAQTMAIKAGADTLEHIVFSDERSIELLVESGIPITPTLSHRTDHAIQVRKDQGTPKFILEKMKSLQPHCYESFQKIYKAGGNIVMGTDMGYDPEMGENAGELEIWVDLGMKPMDAIVASTKAAAKAMKLDSDLGSIESGKLADIIAVKGDPLKNIRVLRDKASIQLVMKDGKVCVDRRRTPWKTVVTTVPEDLKIIDA
jgi:imidazolonepropionase-like amidohydrolase